jgi:hypothetical protein
MSQLIEKIATPAMTNNLHPQSQQNIYINQENRTKNKDAHGDVRQDKRAKTSARTATVQPARSHIPLRAEPLTTKNIRSQNAPNARKAKEKLTLWIDPIVKAEVQRRAKRQGLSESEAGAALLKKGIQVDLDVAYGALLTPVF